MTGPEAAALPLHEWEGFYVIVGTSAAALTGLMFVVIAVVADAGPRSATPRGIATFITPTIGARRLGVSRGFSAAGVCTDLVGVAVA